ncbi:MAG: DNA-binding Lrp family transcriptional regulator [Cognaticolwellia sp.]|jgi:DNA-binding Lrp family transcriptional regulator
MEFPVLDRTDRSLLRLLQEDARRPFKELATKVALASSTVHERVARLRKQGVLRGIHADVDHRAFGLQIQAMVFVRLRKGMDKGMDKGNGFAEQICLAPWVLNVYHLAGRQDFALHIVARDTDQLREQVMAITEREEVRGVETSLIFEHRRSHVMPDYSD